MAFASPQAAFGHNDNLNSGGRSGARKRDNFNKASAQRQQSRGGPRDRSLAGAGNPYRNKQRGEDPYSNGDAGLGNRATGLNGSATDTHYGLMRNESKGSASFNSHAEIKHQQERSRMAHEPRGPPGVYQELQASPDIGVRKMNAKVGVHLAPLNHNGVVGTGRTSMMSIKGLDDDGGGSEAHPILRMQNFRKPQLEKINHAQIGQKQVPQQ